MKKNANLVSSKRGHGAGAKRCFTPGTGEPGTELFHIFAIATLNYQRMCIRDSQKRSEGGSKCFSVKRFSAFLHSSYRAELCVTVPIA